MDVLGNRIRQVVESVLENESLADGLDEKAAEVLQQWGIASATRTAENTGDLSDEAAEQAMYPHLRAVRRLTRAVRNWARHQGDANHTQREKLWGKMVKRAKAVYGEEINLPTMTEFEGSNAAQIIVDLRAWFEDKK